AAAAGLKLNGQRACFSPQICSILAGKINPDNRCQASNAMIVNEQMSDAKGQSIMLYQTMQVAEDRRREMLLEAEKYRMLANIGQHEDGPVRRALTFTGQTLIAIG